MKKIDIMLKEYVTRLSADTLKFLSDRLYYRFPQDLGDVLDHISKNAEIDKWLSSAKDGIALFEMIDHFQIFVDKECSKRDLILN